MKRFTILVLIAMTVSVALLSSCSGDDYQAVCSNRLECGVYSYDDQQAELCTISVDAFIDTLDVVSGESKCSDLLDLYKEALDCESGLDCTDYKDIGGDNSMQFGQNAVGASFCTCDSKVKDNGDIEYDCENKDYLKSQDCWVDFCEEYNLIISDEDDVKKCFPLDVTLASVGTGGGGGGEGEGEGGGDYTCYNNCFTDNCTTDCNADAGSEACQSCQLDCANECGF